MEQLRQNVNSIINRTGRLTLHENLAEMESDDGDINTNLERRICEMNIRKMREMQGEK